jgi:hypothetical protein
MARRINVYQQKGISNNDNKDKAASCVSMVLGSLIKEGLLCGLWPIPGSPYQDLPFIAVASNIRDVRVRELCERDRAVVNIISSWAHVSSRNSRIGTDSELEEIESELAGLSLEEYVPNKE